MNDNVKQGGMIGSILEQIERARVEKVRKDIKPMIEAVLVVKEKTKKDALENAEALKDKVRAIEEFCAANGVKEEDIGKMLGL